MYILFQFTTYICVQDISWFSGKGICVVKLTTYICIQDISGVEIVQVGYDKCSQPTYAYKIYRLICSILLQGCSHNLHMHTRYIPDALLTSLCFHSHNLHMHTRYIAIFCIISSWLILTTYICIQDISVRFGTCSETTRTHNLHMHTRYISTGTAAGCGIRTHNLHMHTRYIAGNGQKKWCRAVSQPTYAYKIYHLEGEPRQGDFLTTYICIQDISEIYQTWQQANELTTYICIQDISAYAKICCGDNHAHNLHMHTRYIGADTFTPFKKTVSQPTYAYKIYHQINTNISCLQGLNL